MLYFEEQGPRKFWYTLSKEVSSHQLPASSKLLFTANYFQIGLVLMTWLDHQNIVSFLIILYLKILTSNLATLAISLNYCVPQFFKIWGFK